MSVDSNAGTTLWRKAFAHMQANEQDALDWARSVSPDTFRNLRSKAFLREYCFVVYASGFRFHTIKAKFPDLADAFHNFDIDKLSRMRSTKQAVAVFGNERKARNFLAGAKQIAAEGFANFKKRLSTRGVCTLTELPGIGPITKDHLAKNIGLSDVAKADIWLERAASVSGADSVTDLVDFLHETTGESRHVIDVVLWTYGRDGLLLARS